MSTGKLNSPIGHTFQRLSQFIVLVIALRTLYDSSNPAHEERLLLLWRTLKPETELDARHSTMWGDIGFQGHDPATDFRGMTYSELSHSEYLSCLNVYNRI